MIEESVLDPKKSALIKKRRELRQGEQKEKLDDLFMQLRQREEHCELLMHTTRALLYPSRWLSEPYREALCHWINIRTLFRYYERGHNSRREFARAVRKLLTKIRKCYKEAGDRMSAWTVEDQLP
jgi:hypothetical protein